MMDAPKPPGLDWFQSTIEWSPDGYKLTIPISASLNERYGLAVDRALQSSAVVERGFYYAGMIEITSNSFTATDPTDFRIAVDQVIEQALADERELAEAENASIAAWHEGLTDV